MSKKVWIVVAIIAVVAAGAGALYFAKLNKAPVAWRTAAVERGDIKVQVTATGSVNPHFNVQVGTQVSGTVAKLFVDFNSHVKKGQVVALLDTTLLYAAVQDARATLFKAQSQMVLTKQTSARTSALFAKGLVAQADLDQAVADSSSAASQLSSAKAGLDRAKINLQYATIISPITGVVVNRSVDVGQTVAASFNTPTIFSIADDLSKMQVQASIDEADIGQVKVGQNATFTVDAYPARTFKGVVSQIRLQPTTVQNVVSYTVMVDLDNSDLALLPGMTANVTVEVQKVENVLTVPAAALKFMPPFPPGQAEKWRKMHGADTSAAAGKPGQFAQRDSTGGIGHARGMRGDSSQAGHGQGWKKGDNNQDPTKGRVFILTEGKPVRVPVKVGLSNGGFTEVEGDLQPGQAVIVGVLNTDKNKPAAQSPMGGGAPPGMGRRF